ncbi:hypothetical protein G7074_11195 [Pedobacter sp. HDW13]|uniref:hypothetical protein n=1 Tax=unclassified Pedobacter TaxID=2628915 RepID=UPI000F59C948|nr:MULTISPECIES: hypothetical protein [unclassified Pedobacter]QIL39783.1 hypothetical protein G7074_11195 [Pedobacter sp. HDW13]RQO79735.1 hypothetical protein DBR40_01910 [Pedobacter sp. KBW01]
MGNKFSLTALLLIVWITVAKAQSNYQATDSTSLALFNAAEWQQLIVFGKAAINKGEDFPLLRLRVAYASFVRGNYIDALVQYNKVLANDKHNQIALYYAYLCNINLNRPENAGWLAVALDTARVEGKQLRPFKITSAGAESGIKFTNIYERGNSSYSRAFVNFGLTYKLNLSTSFSYYNQPVHDDHIVQPGYYAKLSYTPLKRFSFIGAYHYMRSDLRQLVYQNNAILLGVKYAGDAGDLQGDFVLSQIGDEKTRQYNMQFVKYLSGNLDFYSISRFSLVDVLSDHNIVVQQLFGIKPISKLWFEGVVTLGNQYNYAEADALYIYNGFDKTKFKAGANCYFLLKQHLLLGLNYTFERKSDNIFKFNYLQHSINGGITWSF